MAVVVIILNAIGKTRGWTTRSAFAILVHRRRERGQGDARHDCPTIARGDGSSDCGGPRAPALGRADVHMCAFGPFGPCMTVRSNGRRQSSVMAGVLMAISSPTSVWRSCRATSWNADRLWIGRHFCTDSGIDGLTDIRQFKSRTLVAFFHAVLGKRPNLCGHVARAKVALEPA